MDEWIDKRIKHESKTQRIISLLTSNPGATVRQLSDKSGIARDPVKSALNGLIKRGKVQIVTKEYPHQKPRVVGYYYVRQED